MIDRIIEGALRHRAWVIAAALVLLALTTWVAVHSRLDALPDLSDTQVIVKVSFPGQPPRLVEDQVTYPLTTALMGIPGATTVRAVSMFGEALVYVVLAEGSNVDIARERILERTTSLAPQLPATARLALGADASGTGWIYQYALVARHHDLPIDRLQAIQQFFVKPELQGVPGVAEVATFGGASRELRVELEPSRLASFGLTAEDVATSVRDTNLASGGGTLDLGGQRFLLSADARAHTPEDFLETPVARDATGAIVRLSQIARVNFGPAPLDSVGDLNGEGNTVGGILIMRQGENARGTLAALERRLAQLRPGLPPGVDLVVTYDRAVLIDAAVRNLLERLVEEALVVTIVCGLFLGRLRSSLVILLSLPLGLLAALAVLRWQGITANIMSLGGLAIAVGAMTDAAIVMVEALHRRLETNSPQSQPHRSHVSASAREVGPALFFSLWVITVSFLPVFGLQGQEGMLFAPLALTKTYAMATAAALSITLVPVLMELFVRSPVKPEGHNPLNRVLRNLYRPVLDCALRFPRLTLVLAGLVLLSIPWPLARLGSEFMPPLDEGDLLYMPSTLANVSADEAARILRVSDRLIRQIPEVASVHGKAGRSDSATDPAALSMLETTIRLKPRAEWARSRTPEQVLHELEATVQLPGLSPSWGYPIRTRIDMLASGVKTALALRVSGPDVAVIQSLCERAERVLNTVPGIRSAFAERPSAGRYLDVRLDRRRAAVSGVTAAQVTQLVAGVLGGQPVDTVSDGRERYPVVIRFLQANRDSLEAIRELRVRTVGGTTVSLAQIADVRMLDGPTELRSENARPAGYVLLDLDSSDVGGTLDRAEAALRGATLTTPGYTTAWVGQYLRLRAASQRLTLMTAATVLCVLLILYLHFRDLRRVAVVMLSLPFGATGGVWLMWWLGYHWSFAAAVGFLALAGIAAEFSVVMLLYLDQATQARANPGPLTSHTVRAALIQGALLRLRPKAMTVAVILGGLLPLMLSDGVGADVTRRIAAPMLGGMVTAPLFSLIAVPVIYLLKLSTRSPLPRPSAAALASRAPLVHGMD